MCTLKTVGIVILVIVLVIICFSLIGFVFSLVRILLEAAIIVGKEGRNLQAKDADAHVFGFVIMNDF